MHLSTLTVTFAVALVVGGFPLGDGARHQTDNLTIAPRDPLGGNTRTQTKTTKTTTKTTATNVKTSSTKAPTTTSTSVTKTSSTESTTSSSRSEPKSSTSSSGTRSASSTSSGISSTSSAASSGVRPSSSAASSSTRAPSSTASASNAPSGISQSSSQAPSSSAPLPSSSASAAPLSCPRRRSFRINRRAGIDHPSAKQDITLFHGTLKESTAEKIMNKIELQSTEEGGDLNDRDFPALYMTDSVIAAAQFVCGNVALYDTPPTEAYVVELRWEGSAFTAESDIKEFTDVDETNKFTHRKDDDEAARKIMKEAKMITSRMKLPDVDALLADDFWQYALLDEDSIKTGKITAVAKHKVLCRNVPVGKDLTSEKYEEGQRCNRRFSSLLEELTNGNGNADWDAAYKAFGEDSVDGGEERAGDSDLD